MKNYFLVLFFSFLLLSSAGAWAVIEAQGPGQIQGLPTSSVTDFNQIINQTATSGILITLLRWVYVIFFIVAIFFILLSAYNFIRGGNNEPLLQKAKKQLLWAVVAIIIAVVSWAVPFLIRDFISNPSGNFGNGSTTTPTDLPPGCRFIFGQGIVCN